MTPSIRPAKRSDLERFYPDGLPGTMRALVVEVDGDVAILGGIVWSDPMQCISHVLPAGKRYPKLIWRIAKRLIGWMDEIRAPVYALADPEEPTAERLLERMGFTELHDSPAGRVYLWRGD